MAAFFEQQMDYIFFAYGLSFLVMAQTCFSMSRPGKQVLPWRWLGLFGLAHGLNEWLDLAAAGFSDFTAFRIIRACVLIASFLSLLEFGRAGTLQLNGRGPGRWIHIPLFAAALLGGAAGLEGLNAAVRYALGLTGGLWAGYALFSASKEEALSGRGWLLAAGITIGMYAVFTGLVVPWAPFFPASVVNNDSFFGVAGFPVQLARGLLALFSAVAVTGFSRSRCRVEIENEEYGSRPVCAFIPVFSVMAILCLGWFITEAMGSYADGAARRDLVARTLTASAAVNPERVARLTGTPADVGTPDYERLLSQLRAICDADCKADPHGGHEYCRFVYLMGMRDGRLIFLVDAGPERSEDSSSPGQVYLDAEPSEIEDYREARVAVQGPFTDSGGRWVTGVAPILDREGKVVAQFGMDIDSRQWENGISLARSVGIAITLALSMLSMVVFIAWQRTKESAAHAAALRVAALRLANEKKLRDLTSALGEGVFVLDDKGRLTFMNPEAERLLGWSEAELLGKDLHGVIHRHNADGTETSRDTCDTLSVLDSGASRSVEDVLFTRKDGTALSAAYVAAPIIEGGKKVVGVVTAFQDITERKRIVDELRESEARLSEAEIVASFGSWEWRIAQDKVLWSGGMWRIFGIDPNEFGGVYGSYLDFVHPDDKETVMKLVAESVGKVCPLVYDARIVRKDGAERVIHVHGEVSVDDERRPVRLFGTVQDVTERRRAEEKLRLFSEAVEAAPDGIQIADLDGYIVYSNRAFEEIMGYSPEECAGMHVKEFHHDQDLPLRVVIPSIKGTGRWVGEIPVRRKDGSEVPVWLTTSLVRDPGGRPAAMLGITRDLTDRKALERQRADFYAMVTHDLKSPLTAILGFTEILLDEKKEGLDPDSLSMVKSIRNSGSKLYRMVDDFLAVSRLESGNISLNEASTGVGELLLELYVEFAPAARQKGLAFERETGDGLGSVLLDRMHVYRACSNLIQNALNYTPQGGCVRVSAVRREVDGLEYAAISVSDTGPGIAAGEKERIFEKYYRSPRSAGIKGSGLGLAVVKAVASAHGGWVELASSEGKGCTFTLCLPMKNVLEPEF